MIHFNSVVVCYEPYKAHPVASLDGVSLHIARGEWVFLVGPSGAGKSSLLRLLYAGTRAIGGSVEVDGRDITRIKAGSGAGICGASWASCFRISDCWPIKPRGKTWRLPCAYWGVEQKARACAMCRALWKPSVWTGAPTLTRTNFRAASSNAWRSRAPSSTIRRYCVGRRTDRQPRPANRARSRRTVRPNQRAARHHHRDGDP